MDRAASQSSVAARPVRFTQADLDRFSKASRDVNPLHMDPDYGRRSAFGQPVVFGALGGLACLQVLPAQADGALQSVTTEFRQPLFLNLDYTAHLVAQTETHAVAELRDGDLVLVRLEAVFGPVHPADQVGPPAPTDTFPKSVRLRKEPQQWSDKALATLPEIEGTYRWRGKTGRFPLCGLAFHMASYVIGMEIPGRRALFSKAAFQFAPAAEGSGLDDVLCSQLKTERFEECFGTLDVSVAAWSKKGLLFTGTLGAFALKSLDSPIPAKDPLPEALQDQLTGKVAFVTGGSRGLGAALVRALAWAGCSVVVNYKASAKAAAALAEELENAPGEIVLLQGDAGDPAWLAEARSQILARLGGVDVVISNACAPPVTLGTGPDSLVLAQRYEDDNFALATGVIDTLLADVAHRSGAIVAVSSSILDAEGSEWPHYRRLKTRLEERVQDLAAQTPDVAFLLPRPPALLTDMSNTPVRAAQALNPSTVAEAVLRALIDPKAGHVRMLRDFSSPPTKDDPALGPEPDQICIAASFTHEMIRPGVTHWLETLSLPASLCLTAYGQMFKDLLDPSGPLLSNRRGLNVLLIRIEDWVRHATETPEQGEDRSNAPTDPEKTLIRESLSASLKALSGYGKRTRCTTALLLCPGSDPTDMHPDWQALIAETETALMVGAQQALAEGICLRVADYHEAYGITADFLDPVRGALAHIPYTDPYHHLLATLVLRCFVHARSAPTKVLVLDCDNTLWGGVVGEAGPTGVDLTGPYHAFQTVLVEQAARGVLLCLCSKNVEEDVWAVFDANPDMPLKRSHIVDARINWMAKSGNIRSLAESLNLGLDSFVFLDDSPVECAEVRANCPEVTTLQWPTEPAEIRRCLTHLWVFDRFLATEEDSKRGSRYRQQVERGRLRAQSSDFAAFLAELNLQIDVRPLVETDLARAAQLTQRTNQFNFTTRRKTAGELRHWSEQPDHEVWTVRVQDRFGDYGLVGVLLLCPNPPGTSLEIETLLLSCRVLGRGVEHRMLAHAGERAQAQGLSDVAIGFAASQKNKPARLFLETVLPDLSEITKASFVATQPADKMAAVQFLPGGQDANTEQEVAQAAETDDLQSTTRSGAAARAREQALQTILSFASLEALSAAIDPPDDAPKEPRSESGEQGFDALKSLFAQALGLAADDLDAEASFERYGIDSMKIVELTVALKQSYPDLPVTFLFEHKTLGSVATALGVPPPNPSSEPASPARGQALAQEKGQGQGKGPASGEDAIAIIGMNGRFPGAPDLPSYWELLKNGRCAIGPIPPDRWEVDAFYSPDGGEGKSYSRVGGFISDIDQFDAGFFRISPKEAELMDPQQRLMLHCVWGLLEDAGYSRASLDRDTGVFIGALSNDYGAYANNAALQAGGAYRNADFYQIPNRISYAFDLHGPSLTIDSACSASGTAMHFALQSLRSGGCRTAIVGGINLFLHPSRFVQYAQMRMISPSARCSPFGAQADGTLFGEGLGTVLLKPLSRALADGDNIHGLLLSCAVNSGGRSNGFTVPDPDAQAALIARAIREAGIPSGSIGYVEAHGTGTPLGDPIEIRGLAKAFAETAGPEVGPPCALGAVKANIGHLESGAAMAGLLKTLLQMRHRTLVPSLHAEQLNAEIDFTNAPFRLQRDLMPWPERVLASAGADPVMPLRAGISSFGAGGSNAHMVVEESPLARLPDRRPAAIGPWLFPLSAHRPEVLKALVEKLVAFLRIEDGAEGEPDLADMAFTLQMGREALSERLVVLAHSVDDLVVRLAGWLAAAGTLEDPCLFAGTARPARRKPGSMTDAPIGIPEGASLSDVASHWVQGGVVDWSKLQQTDRPSRRISLPLYPFAGGRHWLAGSPNQELTTMLGLTPSPARADLETESQVLFSARDAVIRDHSVQGQTILPGVGYLDHVLRTVQAAQALSKGQYCRLEQVVWSHPFVLQEGERSLWVQLAPEGDNRAFALRSDKQGPAHAKGLYRLLDREPSNALQALNPEALDQACSLSLDKGAIYDRFAALDIAYGPLFQGLDWIRLGTDEAFSQVSLAEGQALPDRTETVLHPTLADGALQTALLLACQDGTARLPFALERLTLVRPLPARCLVHVTAGIKADCYDITLADEQGAPCLRIEAVVFRERADPLKDMVHLPRWEAKGSAGVGVPASVNAPDQTVVVYGATSAAEPVVQALREAYGADQILELGVDRLAPQLLCDAGAIDQIYVLGGLCEPDVDPLDPDGLAAQEQAGVLGFFRLLKVMQRLDLTRSAITIRIVTHGVAALSPGQPVLPAAASLVGLAKVAAKEFPKLRIACIDLDPKTLMNCRSPADRAEMLRWIQAEQDSQGAPVLIREGTRHVQALLPIALPAGHVGGAQAMPDGVTCLILGGAGGLGLAFSRHLARTRQAALIWLGRRPEDATIRSRIAEVEALGGRVLYCQADATDPVAVAEAVAKAKGCFGPIQGVVHSALVLEDRSIANMDEAAFRRGLVPKSRAMAVLYQAVCQEPLSFFLLFSSINSFQASAGQANYVAGCHAKDALGLALHGRGTGLATDPRIRILNWGFWGSVGVVAKEAYRDRLAAEGHGSLEPDVGMEAIERALSHALPQLVVLKASAERRQKIGVDLSRPLALLPHAVPALLGQVDLVTALPALEAGTRQRFQDGFAALEQLGQRMLVETLRGMGLPLEVGQSVSASELCTRLNIQDSYQALVQAFLELLQGCGVLAAAAQAGCYRVTGRADEAAFRSDRAALEADAKALGEAWPEVAERLPLLMACYRAWPQVLSGQMSHMEVLFPRGDLSLVAPIYRGNAITAAFNAGVAKVVRDVVEARLAADPEAEICILEVGAGTGSTSAPVLEAIAAFGERLRYVYTDVSRRFLLEGEESLGTRYPFVSFKTFDFEQDPLAQGFEPGSVDLVLGTNCVHACARMDRTLGHLKAVMKRQALLVLNEFTERLDYNTLTFGLTSGWWLFEDPENRIPGSPLLSRSHWQRVLEIQGFGAPVVLSMGEDAQDSIGQDLILAESDGVWLSQSQTHGSEDPPPAMALTGDPKGTSLATSPPLVADPNDDPADQTLHQQAVAYGRKIFAEVLRSPVSELDPDLTFDAFGVDSLLSTAILERFEQDLGSLSSTLMFEYQTIDELAAVFCASHRERLEMLTGWSPQAAKPAAMPAPPPQTPPQSLHDRPEIGPAQAPDPVASSTLDSWAQDSGSQDIAIIGLSVRFPGAEDLEAFWSLLSEGRSGITEVPAERWDWRDATAGWNDPSDPASVGAKGLGSGRWGGFLADVDAFDALFFSISPREAARIAPETRLFLQTAWNAIEQAGYTPKGLKQPAKGLAGDVGVFAGCMYQHYPMQSPDPMDRGALAGTSYWSIANRVSHFLDFQGPSLAIDTACSSSLTAIHMACDSLRRGECATALAGGVNLTLDAGKYLNLRQAGMLASTPESRALGDGDGLIPAEGVGVVVLKPLAQAKADGDRILGVIKASVVNNGGRTAGFTVPNPKAQADLVGAALDRAGIHPQSISYVEVAANGSALGDPVEITGLTKAFRRRSAARGFCPIGAVKSNIGHPEAASGMAQLAKVLLQMQHKTLVPSLNAEPLNPKLALEDSPFRVQHQRGSWTPPAEPVWAGVCCELGPPRRRAGLSAFGAGGSNAHLIIEEPSWSGEALEPSGADRPQIIVLSARCEDRLQARVQDLVALLHQSDLGDGPSLADMAYTLQTGREAMRVRLACVVADRPALEAQLSAVLQRSDPDAPLPDGVVQNTLSPGSSPLPLLLDDQEGRDYVATLIAARRLEKLAQLWALGLDIDWSLLHPAKGTAGAPRRCALPGYPFARTRHWLDRTSAPFGADQHPVPAVPPVQSPPSAAPGPVLDKAMAGPKAVRPDALDGPAQLRTQLKVFLADILKLPETVIDVRSELRDYGCDSINLGELTTRVNAHFGLDLTVDLFFGHPTIEHCVQFLWQEFGSDFRRSLDEGPSTETVQKPEPPPREDTPVVLNPVAEPVAAPPSPERSVWHASDRSDPMGDPIAIIGMAGYMPQSEDLTAFWDHLVNGRSLIGPIPPDRLDQMGTTYDALCQAVETPVVQGSFLERLDQFDSLFFGISPREASLMDPQQRLLLEVVWKAIEDAGYAPSSLAGGQIGVFVGVSNHDYSKLYRQQSDLIDAHCSTGMMVQSILANRVSFLFDFHGPSEIIDTACSSTTVALHRAAQSLRDGSCETAIVGGVNALLDWQGFAILNQAGILSRDGQVRLFDPDGTGYVRGEGVGAVLLKPLSKALADRDPIHGLIRGSATSFDGKKYSLTAPSPQAQAEAVKAALRQSGLPPNRISHIEAQGTGSALGDPVELSAFKAAFRDQYRAWGLPDPSVPHCTIGYLKPQIGHLEAASGMAGLFKILLAMAEDRMPGTANLPARLPEAVQGSPFTLSDQCHVWDRPDSVEGRCAGLHSFGLGGMNAHVILEEFVGAC